MHALPQIDAVKAAQAVYPGTVIVFVTLPAVQLEESFAKPFTPLSDRFKINWADVCPMRRAQCAMGSTLLRSSGVCTVERVWCSALNTQRVHADWCRDWGGEDCRVHEVWRAGWLVHAPECSVQGGQGTGLCAQCALLHLQFDENVHWNNNQHVFAVNQLATRSALWDIWAFALMLFVVPVPVHVYGRVCA